MAALAADHGHLCLAPRVNSPHHEQIVALLAEGAQRLPTDGPAGAALLAGLVAQRRPKVSEAAALLGPRLGQRGRRRAGNAVDDAAQTAHQTLLRWLCGPRPERAAESRPAAPPRQR